MSKLRNLLLSVGGGLLLSAAFPDINIWLLAVPGLACLFIAISSSNGRGGFGLGWSFGMAFFLPHLWWAEFAVGPVPWLALSSVCSLFIGLATMCFAHANQAGFFDRKAWLTPFAFALLWVGAEIARSYVPFGGFPWGRLAFGVVDSPIANLAFYGGAPLVSFAVALVGGVAGLAVLAVPRKAWATVAGAPLLIVGVLVAPIAVPLDVRPENGTLHVGWVQGNVPNQGLDSFRQAYLVTENHVRATELLAFSVEEPLDLVLWPENSADYNPKHDERTRGLVNDAARAVNSPIILGTADYTPAKGRYNVSMVWLPTGHVQDEYRKQQPAAFAEYIPIREIARKFSDAVDRVSRDMLAGTEPAYVDVSVVTRDRLVRVGTIICFEVAYDWIPRQSATYQAEFLAVQTNNATFGVTAESTQQLAMSRLRAIETGKAVFQVSTVGVSAVIDPAGRVLEQSELFTQDFGSAEIPLRTSITPAVKFGGWISLGFLLAGTALSVWACVSRIRNEYQW